MRISFSSIFGGSAGKKLCKSYLVCAWQGSGLDQCFKKVNLSRKVTFVVDRMRLKLSLTFLISFFTNGDEKEHVCYLWRVPPRITLNILKLVQRGQSESLDNFNL